MSPNGARHRIAVRWRFLLEPKVLGWAARGALERLAARARGLCKLLGTKLLRLGDQSG
jgi:hypothetical protein